MHNDALSFDSSLADALAEVASRWDSTGAAMLDMAGRIRECVLSGDPAGWLKDRCPSYPL